MTGKGHRWTGVGAAFFAATVAHLTHLSELVAAAMAMASVTMPDWAEFPFYRNGVRSGSLIAHRTLTHWPGLWMFTFGWGLHEQGFIGAILVGISCGAMTHILGDAPNPMGVPWFLPNRRVKLGKRGWWRSGEHEPFLALCFGAAGFVLWRLVGTVY